MSRFVQIHMLTSYPPANLNRDDQGRPKTAKMGGFDRLRVSSQSLKRAWRTSEMFVAALGEHIGTRTKRIGFEAAKQFESVGLKQKDSIAWGKEIAGAFADTEAPDKNDPYFETFLKQPVHISAEEYRAVEALVTKICAEKRKPQEDELSFLRKQHQSVDIALFGRMLAAKGKPNFGMEAACQVAHAISVHPVVIEDDYFIAVDDLNDGSEDLGAAHIGETGFAAGLFYSYICINREQLIENLGGDEDLAKKAIKALTEAAVKISPSGKQNSFGSRAYASYVLVEKGDQQPRSLSVAFLKPTTSYGVDGTDFGTAAVAALTMQRKNMDAVYGKCSDACYEINAFEGKGTLAELLTFAAE